MNRRATIPSRRFILVLLLLVAGVGGAIVNIAVAWTLALWVTLEGATPGPVDDDTQLARWCDARSWTDTHRPVWFADERGFGRRRAHLSAMVISGFISMPADFTLELSGWPLLALEGYTQPEWTGGAYIWHDHDLARWPIGQSVAPLRPIWPAFAINTIFYAAILWLIFFLPLTLRRRRRIRRGLCAKCGYDLRAMPADSNACPECGALR